MADTNSIPCVWLSNIPGNNVAKTCKPEVGFDPTRPIHRPLSQDPHRTDSGVMLEIRFNDRFNKTYKLQYIKLQLIGHVDFMLFEATKSSFKKKHTKNM